MDSDLFKVKDPLEDFRELMQPERPPMGAKLSFSQRWVGFFSALVIGFGVFVELAGIAFWSLLDLENAAEIKGNPLYRGALSIGLLLLILDLTLALMVNFGCIFAGSYSRKAIIVLALSSIYLSWQFIRGLYFIGQVPKEE